MNKRIINKTTLEPKIIEGMTEIASIVKRTLGPGGLPIIIERVGQALDGNPLSPKITKDGVSVANECFSDDPEKDLVIQTVKAICKKTNSKAGDGPQPLYSKVLTPKGFVNMGDLEIGDELCGTNGSTQTILGIYPKGEKEVMEIVFEDGRVVECCGDHLWNITDNHGVVELKTAEEMFSAFSQTQSNSKPEYFTPNTVVDFLENKEEMELDPYLVGVLFNDSRVDRYIPRSYLYSSVDTRKQLLQGLLYSSGHINKNELFTFSTISKKLSNDFLNLTRSLGISCKYELYTNIHQITQLEDHEYGSKIVDIIKTNKKTEMQCIKVSNDDHLYITDNYVVTHNTTTAIILGESILKETLKVLDEDNSLNPQLVKEDLERVSKEVIDKLRESVTKVNDMKTINHIATISANGDKEIGNVISEAFGAVGAEGVVTVDEGMSTNKITLDVVEGYQFNRGGENRDAFFNSADNQSFEATNVSILIYDGKLQNPTDLMHVLTVLVGMDENNNPIRKVPPVLVIANEFSPSVIQLLMRNKIDNGFQFCAVKGPHMTHIRSAYYEDLAVMTGATKLGSGSKILTNFVPDDAGLVDKVIVDKYKTTLYGGQGAEDEILKRVEVLKMSKNNAETPYDAQVISDRLAALTNGIAKIGVGGVTELEIKEKYDRIEDALNASRAAIEEGIIPGGGVALFNASNGLDGKSGTPGELILAKALKAPIKQLLDNIGMSLTKDIEKRLKKDKKVVFDARDKEYKNALDAGIIDPFKVTRTALENAISIASLLATSGGGIIHIKDKK